MNQLAADAIPFPLQQPVLRWFSGQPLGIQGAGQEERVGGGTAATLLRAGRCGEPGEGLCRWFEPSHQALHHQAFIEREGLGHRTADQTCGHADPEATGEQFVDDEMQGLRHLTPELQNGFRLLLILLAAELRQQGFHPPVQRTGLE